MPRTPKNPKPIGDVKPYDRTPGTPSPTSSESRPLSSDLSPVSPKKKPSPDGKGKGWTVEEHLQLFERVSKAGMGRKTWEGAVDGRTPNQCYQAWIGTVAPFLKKALSEKSRR